MGEAVGTPSLQFDASITIGDHNLADTGLAGRRDVALDAVRKAVRAMDGADWIDVDALGFPPECQGWVTIYPAGRCITPDTPEWRGLQRLVEDVAMAAMVAAAAPF